MSQTITKEPGNVFSKGDNSNEGFTTVSSAVERLFNVTITTRSTFVANRENNLINSTKEIVTDTIHRNSVSGSIDRSEIISENEQVLFNTTLKTLNNFTNSSLNSITAHAPSTNPPDRGNGNFFLDTSADVINRITNSPLEPSNNFTTNVTLNNSHDISQDPLFTIQEQVIIGAGATVLFLAITALVLRALMPQIRKCFPKEKDNLKSDKEDDDLGDLTSSYPSFSLSSESEISQTPPSSDWSDSYSEQTRSTVFSIDSQQSCQWKAGSFGNLKGSTLSLPMFLPSDTMSLARSCSAERLNETLMAAISQKKMVPWSVQDSAKFCLEPDSVSRRESTPSLKTVASGFSLVSRAELDSLCSQSYNNKYKSKDKGKSVDPKPEHNLASLSVKL